MRAKVSQMIVVFFLTLLFYCNCNCGMCKQRTTKKKSSVKIENLLYHNGARNCEGKKRLRKKFLWQRVFDNVFDNFDPLKFRMKNRLFFYKK